MFGAFFKTCVDGKVYNKSHLPFMRVHGNVSKQRKRPAFGYY